MLGVGEDFCKRCGRVMITATAATLPNRQCINNIYVSSSFSALYHPHLFDLKQHRTTFRFSFAVALTYASAGRTITANFKTLVLPRASRMAQAFICLARSTAGSYSTISDSASRFGVLPLVCATCQPFSRAHNCFFPARRTSRPPTASRITPPCPSFSQNSSILLIPVLYHSPCRGLSRIRRTLISIGGMYLDIFYAVNALCTRTRAHYASSALFISDCGVCWFVCTETTPPDAAEPGT